MFNHKEIPTPLKLHDKQFESIIKDSLLCYAVGDALGAGIEFWDLSDIIKIFGSDRNVLYTRMLIKDIPNPIYAASGKPGDVTDDTFMTMAMMAGITKTMKKFLQQKEKFSLNDLKEFQQEVLEDIFQAFLFLGQYQDFYPDEDANDCKRYLSNDKWPNLEAFKTVKGMGKGVLNILRHGKMGTLEQLPKITSDKKSEIYTVYSKGCGALIRVIPIGLVCTQFPEIDPFEFGCRSGAITHGDAASYLSAGIISEMVVEIMTKKNSAVKAVTLIKDRLIARMKYKVPVDVRLGYLVCLKAITAAFDMLNENGHYSLDTLDKLGLSLATKKNLFTTPPVLAQTLFLVLAAEKHSWPTITALKYAVTQSGDSDSVAAIVGGLLGLLKISKPILPVKYVNELNQTHSSAIKKIVTDFVSTLKEYTKLRIICQSKTSFRGP